MSCSRRHFMAGMGAGALIMMTGQVRAGTATLAHSQTIDGVRYGMIHDETACIGCTACKAGNDLIIIETTHFFGIAF